jgi:hypothetical protein
MKNQPELMIPNSLPASDALRSRFHFDWIPRTLRHPGQFFTELIEENRALWLTPMLTLTITGMLLVLATGILASPIQTEATPSVNSQSYTPEQQAQLQQALAATQGPVFDYVFPMLTLLLRVWVGWLFVGGMLHLVLTLLGGRRSSLVAMNLVAWAGLPLAIRDLVRIGAVVVTHQHITAPGLSGFIPPAASGVWLFGGALLALIDLFMLWHIVLLVIGVQRGDSLTWPRAWGGVLVTVGIAMVLQALAGYLSSSVASLSVVRPFF